MTASSVSAEAKISKIEQWVSEGGEGLQKLILTLDQDPDFSVRGEAARALGTCSGSDVIKPLIRALKNESRHARVAAAEALGRFNDPEVVEPLIEAMSDRDGVVRIKVVDALGKLGDSRALVALAGALNDRSGSVRMLAAEALGRIGNQSAIQPLVQAIDKASTIVRRPAVEALARIADESALEPLLARLNDKSFDVQWTAAEAIAKFGQVRALDPMLDWLQSFLASEVKRLTYDEKIGMAFQIATTLFRALSPDDLELAAARLRPAQRIAHWEAGDSGSGQWLQREVENPLLVWIDEIRQNSVSLPIAHQAAEEVEELISEIKKNLNDDRYAGLADTIQIVSSKSRISYAPDLNEIIQSVGETNGGHPSRPGEARNEARQLAETRIEPVISRGTPPPRGQSGLEPSMRAIAAAVDAELKNMGRGKPEADSKIEAAFSPGRPSGLVQKFLELLCANGLETAALVGGTARDVYLSREPNDLDFTFQARISPDLAQKIADPVVWNMQFAALVLDPLKRLAAALNVGLADLLTGHAEFSADGASIPVHYVGPYMIEEKHLNWEDHQIEQRIRRTMSRLGMICDVNTGRLIGLVGAANADMLWLDSRGDWRGDLEIAEQGLRWKMLKTSVSPTPFKGLSDIFHLLYLQRRHGARLSESAIESLLGASAFCHQNPELAKTTFSRRALDRLLRVCDFRSLVERFALLELTGVMTDLIDAPRLIEMNELLGSVEQSRDEKLKFAREELSAAETERNTRRDAFDSQRHAFSQQADKLDVFRATVDDLESRLREQIKLLVQAEDAGRAASERLESATRRFRELSASDDMDVAVLKEHREALADKREKDAEALGLKQEVESLRLAIDRRQTSSLELQTEFEHIGKTLETRMHELQEAKNRLDLAQRELAAIEEEFNLTPERRRAKLREAWTA